MATEPKIFFKKVLTELGAHDILIKLAKVNDFTSKSFFENWTEYKTRQFLVPKYIHKKSRVISNGEFDPGSG